MAYIAESTAFLMKKIGTRRFYNTNDFFKSLWDEGFFDVAINGDIEVEDE